MLGEPLKRVIYFNPKQLKRLEESARESLLLLPKSRGGRQGLLAILVGSPKYRFAEDLAYLWLTAGLSLTATQEGPFANFMRAVYQAATGEESLENEMALLRHTVNEVRVCFEPRKTRTKEKSSRSPRKITSRAQPRRER